MHAHDRAAARGYLRNAIRAARDDRRLRRKVLEWIFYHEEELEEFDVTGLSDLEDRFRAETEGTDDEPETETETRAPRALGLFRRRRARRPAARRRRGRSRGGHGTQTQRGRGVQRLFLKKVEEAVGAAGPNRLAGGRPESPSLRASRLLAQRLGIEPEAAPVIGLAHHCDLSRTIRNLWDEVNEVEKDAVATTAILLGASRGATRRTMEAMVEAGIADRDQMRHDGELGRFLEVDSVWNPPVEDEEELVERLLRRPAVPRLDLGHFDHLENRDEAVSLLSAAFRDRAPGVNLLFHGRAGTGKTEFAKTLAAAAGGQLYAIGEPGREGTPRGRPEELRMAQALFRRDRATAVLCDEMEDLFRFDSDSKRDSDLRLDRLRLLEDNPVPTIYTANRIDRLDEAVLRRFTVILRFAAHSPRRRATIHRRMLAEAALPGVEDEGALASRLSDELEAAPGLVEQAIRATRLGGGGSEALFRHAERLERAISGSRTIPRLGAPVEARLPWSAFAHLGRDAEDVRASLAAALGRGPSAGTSGRKPGVNLLFYGPPGTGKTEFARTLCGEVGARLYDIGRRELGPEAREAPSRRACLEYALESLADEPGAVILFDEMEDLPDIPKQWLNRLLEENRTPILWTCNATDFYRDHQPFFIDRILHALEFRRVPPAAQEEVYRDLLSGRGLPGETAAALAGEFSRLKDVTPRQVALAADAGTTTAPDGETSPPDTGSARADAVRRAVARKRRLRRGLVPADEAPPRLYDPALLRADRDLLELADRITSCGPRRMGLLFSGPPGTGKTAFVRHLADRWERELLVRRASDLLSAWVGDTEKNLAGAFAEARDTGAILVFDEADSLLADRRGAHRNWEVSRVNELLSQMERHPLPFTCTTNLADRLDAAASRRFLFRAEFRPLDRPRIARAFRLFFEAAAPPEALALTGLTPADFAGVRERAEVLGTLADPSWICRELAGESRAKAAGRKAGAIGFTPTPAPETRIERPPAPTRDLAERVGEGA